LIHRILEILDRGNLSLKRLWQFKCVLIGRNADRLVRVAQGILDGSFSLTLAQNQTAILLAEDLRRVRSTSE
jgi:hypothetical protein